MQACVIRLACQQSHSLYQVICPIFCNLRGRFYDHSTVYGDTSLTDSCACLQIIVALPCSKGQPQRERLRLKGQIWCPANLPSLSPVLFKHLLVRYTSETMLAE